MVAIATTVETAIDTLLTGFVSSKSAALCSAIYPLALSALTIYLIMMGLAIIRGEASDPVHTVLWNFMKIAFITGIALSAGEYQTSIVSGIQGIQGAFISTFSGSTTIGGMLDNMMEPYQALYSTYMQEGSTTVIPQVSLILAALVVMLAQAVLFIIGLGMYILAKVGLALVLAIGPAAILCAMFPATQRFTESWLGAALTFVMTNVLVAVTISMLTSLAYQFAQQCLANEATASPLINVLSLLIISVAMAVILLNIQGIAAQLAGGASISGVGRDVARGISRMMQKGEGKKPSTGGSIQQGGSAGASSAGGGSGGAGTPLYQRQG